MVFSFEWEFIPQTNEEMNYALDQLTYMQAAVGNPDFYTTCYSLYACGSPLETDAGYEPFKQRNLEKAREMAALANDSFPKQPEYLFTYGWVLYQMKDYRKAREWMDKALQNGGEKDPGILEHYGDVLYQLNEPEKAIEYWKQAREMGSGSELLKKKITDKKLYE